MYFCGQPGGYFWSEREKGVQGMSKKLTLPSYIHINSCSYSNILRLYLLGHAITIGDNLI